MKFQKTIPLILLIATGTASARFEDFSIEGDDYRRSEINHRFRSQEMGQRYREELKGMDICRDDKKELEAARVEFENYDTRLESINRQIQSQRNRVQIKAESIDKKQNNFNAENRKLLTLQNKKTKKPQLMSQNKKVIADSNAQLPKAQEDLNYWAKRKKDKCDWRGDLRSSCREAKREKDRAQNKVNTLNSNIQTARQEIQVLNNIDNLISASKRSTKVARSALQREQNQAPTLTQLQNKLQNMVDQRNQQNSNFEATERRYARLAIRTERCMETQYEARKGVAFKRALLIFSENNGQGCEEAVNMISQTRGYAAKEGVNEAYELVCKSDRLVRYEEVLVDDANCDGSNDIGNNPTGTSYIPFQYNSLNQDNLDGIENEVVLSQRGARQIKLDIHGYDIEHRYDYLLIEDARGNEVLRLTNPDKARPETNTVSTGWVDGDTLILRYVTDTRTLGRGFSISGFSVR